MTADPARTDAPLTRRQAQVFDFVAAYISEHGLSPTLLEIGEGLGIGRVTVYEHVKALERKGRIRTRKNLSRSIELIAPKASPLQLVSAPSSEGLPLVGNIAAGVPIDAIPDTERLRFEELFPPERGLFVLRVQGDSMIEDQIRDGDFVVCEQRSSARAGETVVALIEGEETTLKRYYSDGDQVRLEPRNASLSPIFLPAEAVSIQGVVVGVLRRY